MALRFAEFESRSEMLEQRVAYILAEIDDVSQSPEADSRAPCCTDSLIDTPAPSKDVNIASSASHHMHLPSPMLLPVDYEIVSDGKYESCEAIDVSPIPRSCNYSVIEA